MYISVLKASVMSAHAPNHMTYQEGSKKVTYLESPTPIYGAVITIKGRLQVSMSKC